jgi:hypothetical protein
MAARPSSRRSYKTGRNFFARFLSEVVMRAPGCAVTSPLSLARRVLATPSTLRMLVADPTVLPAFITYARAHSLRASTIRLYLSGLLHYAASPVAPIPTLPSNISRLLKACERADALSRAASGRPSLPSFTSWSSALPAPAPQGRRRARAIKRLPLTLDILDLCLAHLSKRACDASLPAHRIFYARALAALLSIGFFGFLRASEYISPPKQPAKWLRWCDVEWEGAPSPLSAQSLLQWCSTHRPSAVILVLRSAKTAKPGAQQRVRVPTRPVGGHLCPVENLISFLRLRVAMPGFDVHSPLFVLPSGNGWSLGHYNVNIRAVLRDCGVPDYPLYSSHSLRHGAASTAMANGATSADIMALGRWTSSAFQTYVSADARSARARAAHEFLRRAESH